MATQAHLDLAQKLYITYYGRAADSSGLEFWADKISEDGLQPVLMDFGNSDEFQNRFGDLSNEALVDNLYQQLFDRSADLEGLNFYVGVLERGEKNLAEIAYEILQGAQEVDQATIDAKLKAAHAYTASAGDDYDLDEGKDVVESPAQADPDLSLTQRADDLQGTSGDDVFSAPVTQDETGSGAVANTFETGDKIDGDEGRDVLNADLTASLSGAVPIAPTISAETNSVEVVNLRAQYPNLTDTTIDAEKMSGVEEWWSVNSRSNIFVEDVRSNPADSAFGMRDTDPGVSFSSFINANYLEGGTEVGESAFNFTIQEANALGDELSDITVNGVRFELNGESYELEGADVEAANTWAELQTALQAEIDATDGLEGLTVEHSGNGQFVVKDPSAGDFVIDPAGTVISSSTTNEVKAASLGLPQITDLPTETDVVLDGVGNGSQGGVMDVGVMSGDRGVEVFNTTVLSDSHITGLQSSNLRTGDQYLEEVDVEGEGDLTIGNTDGTFEGRALNGLTNVRVLDASELDGSLNAGILLNANAVGRYLDDAEGTVDFQYTGTANDDVLSINASQAIAGDPDFAMQVDAGAGDDLIDLVNSSDLAGVSLDGGEGDDTLETASDIGTDEASTPVAFADIEHLVLTGTGTDADMADLDGVQSVNVATDGGSSTVANLEADTTLTISGERQTLGNNSNDDQNFGVITLTDAQAQSQLIELDNTARVDGVLTVGGLIVGGSNSAVRELTLNSGGARQTSNVVSNINAGLVTSLALTGSQALAAEVNQMGQDASGTAVAFDINGDELEGDLALNIEADLLTASNANGEAVTLTGTAGDDDTLTLDGNAIAQDITTDTTATGFETVELGNFAGDLDATNFNGVNRYDVAGLGGATTVTNLKAGENVTISDDGGDAAPLTLEGPGSGTINLTLEDTNENGLAWGGSALSVSGFATVNMALENLEGTNEGNAVNLALDNQVDNSTLGTPLNIVGGSDAAAFVGTRWMVDDVVNDLVITGGNADDNDVLFLAGPELPASMSTIDVSGFAGTFIASLGDAVIEDPTSAGDAISANTDTTFVLSDEDVGISLTTLTAPADPTTAGPGVDAGNADSVDFNTIFEFTAAPAAQVGGAPAVTWAIDNFVSEAAENSGNDNYSILDISDLGIGSFAELDFADAGGNVTITEEGGNSTWEIVLTGVLEADLAPSENFIFA